jgi:hypothetical protein
MDLFLLTLTVGSLIAAVGFGAVAWRSTDEQRRRSAARVAALATALDGDEPASPVAVASIFGTRSGGSLRGRPLLKAAVVALMAILLVVVVAMSSRDRIPEEAPASVAPVADESHAPPLELVSMRHTREGNGLTVTGLVRNPHAGAVVTHVEAVVLAFDRDGNFMVSMRAPLDFTTLAPGDESPFVVKLPDAAAVARYRVSFRTEAGLLRHVDRRAAAA